MDGGLSLKNKRVSITIKKTRSTHGQFENRQGCTLVNKYGCPYMLISDTCYSPTMSLMLLYPQAHYKVESTTQYCWAKGLSKIALYPRGAANPNTYVTPGTVEPN